MTQQRTVAALLTPTGRGAVGTIAIRGPHACAAVARYFSPPASVAGSWGRIRFGRWQRSPEHSGEELVICRTSEDEIEVHCHGGSAAVEAILSDLQSAGAVVIGWQQWVALTSANNQRFAGDALTALASAPTERTAAILLDQYGGALDREFSAIQILLGNDDVQDAILRIDQLLERASFGLHLTQPFRVVLAGAPNVGKSSLINALLGYGRSIVFDMPGTTRDVVSALTAFDGWPVELSDTAGIRDTADTLEAAGVARAAQQLLAADLVLWVTDATADEQPLPPQGLTAAVLPVRNKVDLLSAEPATASGLSVSAATGSGLSELKASLLRLLVPSAPPAGAPVPFNTAQVATLQSWRDQAFRATGH